MTADDFLLAFRYGWIAAGKLPDTREFQLAAFDAWSAYVGFTGRCVCCKKKCKEGCGCFRGAES